MALSIASQTHSVSWQQVTRKIISGDPLEVLDKLDAAARQAERGEDIVLQVALSASAVAYMLVDWSRFTGWRTWLARFVVADAAIALNPQLAADDSLDLLRATGALACGLLRGDDSDALAPLGEHLDSLLSLPDPVDSTQLNLAAAALLPWLQMSKNPAAAQVLHGRMANLIDHGKLIAPGVLYLHAVWLSAWAQHLHFCGDTLRMPDALNALDDYLRVSPLSLLSFRRARLAAEQAMRLQDVDAAERAVRDMLNAMHAKRPMERVIYNMLAGAVATLLHDPDRALLHVTHNLRDLEAADCPPTIASVYRMASSRVYLFRGDYEQAAAIYAQCMEHAHTAHAAMYRGYEQLSNALLLHQKESGASATLLDDLRGGLAAVRAIPARNFFFTAPVARAAVCALALREGIETEFVLAALQEFPVPPPTWADEHWPWAMSLRCFGGFRSVGLDADARASSKASNRPLSLLMLIAANGGHGVPVASATDALWPDQDGDQAENSLSVTLLRLRRLYNETDLIERRNGWLHLNTGKVWTDVAAIEAHLDAMPASTATGLQRTRYVARLFDLYRGDCLFGIDDDWAQHRRTHYRGRVTLAAQRLVQMSLEGNDYAAAELTLTHAFERGLDASRILHATHSAQRSTPAWTELHQHLKLLLSN